MLLLPNGLAQRTAARVNGMLRYYRAIRQNSFLAISGGAAVRWSRCWALFSSNGPFHTKMIDLYLALGNPMRKARNLRLLPKVMEKHEYQ